jgi:preprotein translocase subunit Sec61beta
MYIAHLIRITYLSYLVHEGYDNVHTEEKIMARKDTSGLMSSAGIMRYFEAEESAIKIDPLIVIATAVFFGGLVMALNFYFGRLW